MLIVLFVVTPGFIRCFISKTGVSGSQGGLLTRH